MRGAAAKTIQELAGHTSLSTTLKYMHIAEGEKDRAIALLEQPWHEHGTSAAAK
jgi:site-specific recombinase XerD